MIHLSLQVYWLRSFSIWTELLKFTALTLHSDHQLLLYPLTQYCLHYTKVDSLLMTALTPDIARSEIFQANCCELEGKVEVVKEVNVTSSSSRLDRGCSGTA